MMQRRLSQIAQIPLIIQTALESVTKAFEEFMPDDGEIAEAADELQQTRDALAGLSLDDTLLSPERGTMSDEYASDTHDYDDDDELLSNIAELTEEEECKMYADVDVDELTTTGTEPEPVGLDPNVALFEAEREREAAELELLRAQKLEKINKLDLSWPWGNMEKKIHRYFQCLSIC